MFAIQTLLFGQTKTSLIVKLISKKAGVCLLESTDHSGSLIVDFFERFLMTIIQLLIAQIVDVKVLIDLIEVQTSNFI